MPGCLPERIVEMRVSDRNRIVNRQRIDFEVKQNKGQGQEPTGEKGNHLLAFSMPGNGKRGLV